MKSNYIIYDKNIIEKFTAINSNSNSASNLASNLASNSASNLASNSASNSNSNSASKTIYTLELKYNQFIFPGNWTTNYSLPKSNIGTFIIATVLDAPFSQYYTNSTVRETYAYIDLFNASEVSSGNMPFIKIYNTITGPLMNQTPAIKLFTPTSLFVGPLGSGQNSILILPNFMITLQAINNDWIVLELSERITTVALNQLVDIDISTAENKLSILGSQQIKSNEFRKSKEYIYISNRISLPTIIAWFDPNIVTVKDNNVTLWPSINNPEYNLTTISGSVKSILYEKNNNLSLISLETNNSYLKCMTNIKLNAFICILYPIKNETNTLSMLFCDGPDKDLSFRYATLSNVHSRSVTDIDNGSLIYINGVRHPYATSSYDNTNKYTILYVKFNEINLNMTLGSIFSSRGYLGYIGDFICLSVLSKAK